MLTVASFSTSSSDAPSEFKPSSCENCANDGLANSGMWPSSSWQQSLNSKWDKCNVFIPHVLIPEYIEYIGTDIVYLSTYRTHVFMDQIKIQIILIWSKRWKSCVVVPPTDVLLFVILIDLIMILQNSQKLTGLFDNYDEYTYGSGV